MKTSKDYLDAANATVPRISAEEAVAAYGKDKAVFVDVRDSAAIAQSGTIAGAQRIPRGMLEFMADDASPLHNDAMQKDANIYVMCAVGGQAALAGKTLQDMGYSSVTNIGGFADWIDAGGSTEGTD